MIKDMFVSVDFLPDLVNTEDPLNNFNQPLRITMVKRHPQNTSYLIHV